MKGSTMDNKMEYTKLDLGNGRVIAGRVCYAFINHTDLQFDPRDCNVEFLSYSLDACCDYAVEVDHAIHSGDLAAGQILEVVSMVEVKFHDQKPRAMWQVIESCPDCLPENEPEIYNSRIEALIRADELREEIEAGGFWRAVEVSPTF